MATFKVDITHDDPFQIANKLMMRYMWVIEDSDSYVCELCDYKEVFRFDVDDPLKYAIHHDDNLSAITSIFWLIKNHFVENHIEQYEFEDTWRKFDS